VAIDVSRLFIGDPALAYGLVFSLEAALFVVAAAVGMRVKMATGRETEPLPSFGDVAMAEVMDGR
jgi:BCD family chlorophyll transporter-like MFS transporter